MSFNFMLIHQPDTLRQSGYHRKGEGRVLQEEARLSLQWSEVTPTATACASFLLIIRSRKPSQEHTSLGKKAVPLIYKH